MFTIRSARFRGDDGWNLSDDHPITQKARVIQPMEVSVSFLSVFFEGGSRWIARKRLAQVSLLLLVETTSDGQELHQPSFYDQAIPNRCKRPTLRICLDPKRPSGRPVVSSCWKVCSWAFKQETFRLKRFRFTA